MYGSEKVNKFIVAVDPLHTFTHVGIHIRMKTFVMT